VRVVGLSSAVLFDSEQPLNPINRRISIIVMNKKAEEAARQDGGTVQIDAENGNPDELFGASGVAAASGVAVDMDVPPTEAVPADSAPPLVEKH